MMMYQLPIDMMTRIAERDLGDHVAALPQRLEAVRVLDHLRVERSPDGLRGRCGGRRGAGAGAAVAAQRAPAEPRPARRAAPGASAVSGTMAAGTAMSRTAASAARRIIFNIWSPGNG